MGLRALLGCALHVWIAFSLVLNPPQNIPEIATNPPTALDAPSNTSAIQIASIPSENFPPRISNPTSSLSLANTTALAGNATLTDSRMSCNGAPFTRPGPASYASCQNTFRYTHSGVDVLTFGDRAAGDWDVALPVRIMGDDGLCVIDIDVAEPGQVDHSSLSALQLAAHAILGICVEHHNRGGEFTGLGQDGRLTVTVKPNLPRVQCALSDRPPVAEICEHVVLGDMPASKAQQVFGNRGTSGIDVRVPWAMATSGGQCVVKVQMTAGLSGGPTITTSWYKIWQQAIALTALCAHNGKGGQACFNRGGQPVLTISIVNEARQSLTTGAPDETLQEQRR